MLNFKAIKESIVAYSNKLEENIKKVCSVDIMKIVKAGIVALALTTSAQANIIGVTQTDIDGYMLQQNQTHLQEITGSNIELNAKDIQLRQTKEKLETELNIIHHDKQDNPNYSTIDKLSYLMIKDVLNDDKSLDETASTIEQYQHMFKNLNVVISNDEVKELNNSLSDNKKQEILNHSVEDLSKIVDSNGYSNLSKSDKGQLEIYQKIAKVILEDDNEVLNNSDKIALTTLVKETMHQFDQQHKIVENTIDNDNSYERSL